MTHSTAEGTSPSETAIQAEVPDGSSAFSNRTPWSGAAAAVFALAVVAVASGAGILSGSAYFELLKLTDGAGSSNSIHRVTLASTMLTMAAMQTVLILLIWWAAGWFKGSRTHVLSLARPLDRRTLQIGVAGMIAILGPYNLAVYLLSPGQFADDLRMFSELARSDAAWIACLAVTVGAPVSEELMFRGFLLPAFAKARSGMIGACLATSIAWTLLHVGYSLIGLIEVFVIGLYFGWLMWRFENLKLTMLLHALYNGLQMAILIALPLLSGR
jgi:membrane protease YdiL (CAAX protease family)